MTKLEEYRYLMQQGNTSLAKHHVRLNHSELVKELHQERAEHDHREDGMCRGCAQIDDLGYELLAKMGEVLADELSDISERASKLIAEGRGDALFN